MTTGGGVAGSTTLTVNDDVGGRPSHSAGGTFFSIPHTPGLQELTVYSTLLGVNVSCTASVRGRPCV